MTYINRSDSSALYYEEAGDGPTIVLVHGAGQDTKSWRFVMPALAAQGFRAVAVDLPGHGKSDIGTAGVISDLAVHAKTVLEYIDSVAPSGPVMLAGHSMAGGILLDPDVHADKRIAGVVVVDGTGFTSGTYNDEYLDLVKINPLEWFEVNFRTICSPHTSQERVEEIAFDVSRCPAEVAWSDIVAYSRLDLRPTLDRVTAPVAFVHGADDWSITPAMATDTRAACANAETRMEVLDQVGHFPHVEAPDRFIPAMLSAIQWIQGVSPVHEL